VRRNIPLALIVALALAVGLSNVATADQGSADASAKSGKKGKRGKGKACKGNRGKGKSRGKARRSASASAKGKKGGKGKGCKGGGAIWLEPGQYQGRDMIEVEIRSRKSVFVRFPDAPATCIQGIAYGVQIDSPNVTANKLTAKFVAPPGTRGFVQRWEFKLTADYRYKLVIDSDSSDIGIPCSKRGATFEGKLKKVG
jgi:hypothetical protein